jgi:hypothetical protein
MGNQFHIGFGVVGLPKGLGNFTHEILGYLVYGTHTEWKVIPLDWKHSIFAAREPRWFKKVISLLSLLHGLTL